jgi:type I restriction enzyme S subunit
VKFLFYLGRGRVISQEEVVAEGMYPVYSSQTKDNGCLGYIETFDFDCKQITWTTDGANAGTVFLREGKHNCTNVCGTLQPKSESNNLEFFLYCLQYVTQFYKRPDTNGAKIMNGEMGEVFISLPSRCEQDIIRDFLDHETAKIDTLIEKQQQLIQLLKEKRQAVISHAVTKGLSSLSGGPSVKLRDSGVEWLAEIPEHWRTGRLTYQVDLLVDGTHHSPESHPEGDYLYVTAKNIKEHGFNFSNISYVSSSDHAEIYSRCSVKNDDVLYIKDGATAGIAMVNELEQEFSLLSSVALIRSRKNILKSRYLKHHLNASVFKDEMLNRLSGGAMTRFTIDGISRFNVVIPPIEEQEEIVEYIEARTSQMDVLIAKAETAISFMQERRTALISAAVTGKIDVRDWVAPQASPAHKEVAA